MADVFEAKSDIHSDEVSGKVDHSTAGAQHAVNASPILGHLLGYLIAGHHSGLLDGTSNNACQASRLLKEDLPDWGNAPIEILPKRFRLCLPFSNGIPSRSDCSPA